MSPHRRAAFERAFRPTRSLLVGVSDLPIEESLAAPVERWLAPAV